MVLIEQFRPGGLYGPADASPWMVEIVAGIIEPGETPEAVARREAVEEAGLELGRIEAISTYQPSPGACDEWLHLYVGEVRAEHRGSTGGLVEEHEDIRIFALPREAAVALLDGDRLDNAQQGYPANKGIFEREVAELLGNIEMFGDAAPGPFSSEALPASQTFRRALGCRHA